MIQKIFAALMSFVMSVLSFFGLAVPNHTVYEAVAYGNDSSQVMDIYVPNDAKDNKYNGAVLLIHGGMYYSGSRSDMANRCRELSAKGYIAATMDYTLMNSSSFGKVSAFSMIEEVNLAIQKLKTFSYEQKLNIKKLALFGVSGGGHLALLYSYARPEYSAIDIVFTAAQAAPTDFDYEIWKDSYTPESMANLVSNLSSINVSVSSIKNGSAAETCKFISPVNYINSRTKIPALLAYGAKDTTVPKGNGNSIKNALSKYNVPFDYYNYSNSTNTMSSDVLVEAEFTNMLYRYCQNYFGY